VPLVRAKKISLHDIVCSDVTYQKKKAAYMTLVAPALLPGPEEFFGGGDKKKNTPGHSQDHRPHRGLIGAGAGAGAGGGLEDEGEEGDGWGNEEQGVPPQYPEQDNEEGVGEGGGGGWGDRTGVADTEACSSSHRSYKVFFL
jgi:hypothetical protein